MSRGRARAVARITIQRPAATRLVAPSQARATAGPRVPALTCDTVRQLVSDMSASFGPLPQPAPPLPPPAAPAAPALQAPAPAPPFLHGHVGLFRAIRELDPSHGRGAAQELRAVPVNPCACCSVITGWPKSHGPGNRLMTSKQHREPAEDVKAAAAVKAGKTLADAGFGLGLGSTGRNLWLPGVLPARSEPSIHGSAPDLGRAFRARPH